MSQREIAALVSPNSKTAHKTIETHVQVLKKAGLITVEALTQDEAQKLLAKFGQKLNLNFKDRLNFYSINKQCPFWTGNRTEASRVADLVNDLLRKRFSGGNTRGRTPQTPVEARGETPVEARGETPVEARAKHKTREDVVDTPSSPGKHPPDGSKQTPETAEPSTLTQMSQKGVKAVQTPEEPSSWSGEGGFDLNEEKEVDSPKPKALEGVAGSHPLQGPVDPEVSVTPEEAGDHLSETDFESLFSHLEEE